MEIDRNTINEIFEGELTEQGKRFRYIAYEKQNVDMSETFKNNFLWRSLTVINEAGEESSIVWNPLREALRTKILECAQNKNWL